jgi:Protein of unknown function (DUF4232)
VPVSRCSNTKPAGAGAKPVTAATALTCAAVLAVVLGGCRGPESPSSVAAKAVASAAGSAAPRTAPSPPPPTRPCATTDLAVSAVSHQVKQGLEIERFAVTTANPAGCTLTGPPDLRPKGPLSAQVPGATVDLAVSQLPVPDRVKLGAGSGGTVALQPGGSASFYVAWYSSSPIVCVQSDGFGFNAPGDTSYSDMKPVDYDLGPVCDGIFYVSSVF